MKCLKHDWSKKQLSAETIQSDGRNTCKADDGFQLENSLITAEDGLPVCAKDVLNLPH